MSKQEQTEWFESRCLSAGTLSCLQCQVQLGQLQIPQSSASACLVNTAVVLSRLLRVQGPQ